MKLYTKFDNLMVDGVLKFYYDGKWTQSISIGMYFQCLKENRRELELFFKSKVQKFVFIFVIDIQ